MDVFERAEKVANDLADDWNADFLYINSDIDEEAFDYIFYETEPRRGKGEYLFILLTTEAGSSSSAHKIMSYFKYKYLGVCIVALGQCKEAGKIMCEEALETWVGKASGLGPLDLRGLAECTLGEEAAPIGSLETFLRLPKGTDFFALHEAINAPEICDFVTFREGGVSAFSRAIDPQAKDNSGLITMVDMLPKKSKKYAPGSERDIFYLNGYYC
ncbi:hypothetical protein RFM99_26470 [Mesorhizobium sp. VK4C]|uniref:hypothetical protein n=1 Tax=Mesorhizobium captivum TaxID=3072319 RepID=UPI002A24B466|nr:hypothetical protein [Mesorhizobium sp. VK4C]MDX8501945.1 hypothetical protein [Mesorhizobium sp. VK4C]